LNYLDIVIFIVLLIAFILGYKDGLIRKLIGLTGLIIGIILAVKFSLKLGTLMAPMFDNEIYFARIAAGFIIFIIVIILTAVIKRIVHPHDKVNKMVNQVLGGVTGIIQILFFISGALFLLAIFNLPKKNDQNKSMLYSSVYAILPKSVDILLGGNGYVKSYIQKKENDTEKKVVTKEENKEINKEIVNVKQEQKPKKTDKPVPEKTKKKHKAKIAKNK
jgi:membrane protein required for colicin V production